MTYIEYICDIVKRQANRVPIYTKQNAENVSEDYNPSEKEAAAAVNQYIAEHANEVWLMVSGIPVKVK